VKRRFASAILISVVIGGNGAALWLAAYQQGRRNGSCGRTVVSLCPALLDTARSQLCTDTNTRRCYRALDETAVGCFLGNPQVFKALWAVCGEKGQL
jgi:hypothetical protein